jgi:chemotaxis protein MotB
MNRNQPGSASKFRTATIHGNKQSTGFTHVMYLAVMILMLCSLVSCVTTKDYDKLVKERDALVAENEEFEGRIQLLRSRIANINHELGFQGAIIQIQRDIIKVGAEVIESQEAQIQKQASVIQTQDEALRYIQRTYDTLVAVLEPQVGSGTVGIKIENGILLVNVSAEILFASGSVQLSQNGREVIGKVAKGLGKIPYQVVVAGYTDNVPIGSKLAGRYANNWELGGSRASQVVTLLEKSDIDSRRIIAVSFGENHPVASNDTEEGRAKNRRIEFRIIPIVTVQ